MPPAFHDDLAFATIDELGNRLRTGDLTAAELTRFFLDRLHRFGPTYRALRTPMWERAMDEARRADRRLRADRLLPAPRGDGGRTPPLLGIPYGVKDVFAVRGGPTSWGAPALRDQMIDEDAAVVDALRRGGAVLAAKLSLQELITFRETERPEHAIDGPARNPWHLDRWTGGSSSGSAAAVAAGLVPFALGTDPGGSISTPSAYCGITGLRPSWRAVPCDGA